MASSSAISAEGKKLFRELFVRYLMLTLGVFFIVGAINFYHVLMVAPDTVGMQAFKSAMFSSPGFIRDLLSFLGAAIFIHLVFGAALWLGTAGWLASPDMRERQRKITSYFMFVVACALIMILSARQYPNMPSGFIKHNPLLLKDVTLYLLVALVLLSAAFSLHKLCNTRLTRTIAVGVLLACTTGALWQHVVPESQAKVSPWANNSQPNILVIGIDSLRPDETGYFGSDGELTPHIDEFLQNSSVYKDAYTPYARTFPAWMSILTGKEPVNHKGRFNLIDHSYLDTTQTLAWWMKERGYRTVYGFDERRFNNIDESFGFDVVVGPKPGAMGFVLGQYDHPMINLLANTTVGKYLFPEMYLNRGRSANYDPERYNQALLDEITKKPDQPIFLSVHFLLPHFPWYSRDDEELKQFKKPDNPVDLFAYQYRVMLKQVDRQFGQFMEQLKVSGVLDNAHVFLLSDHGDGFAFDKDILREARDDMPFEVETNTRGHATNVLNLGQYRVVLAGRSYGNESFKPGPVKGNASLMDVVPTVLDLLGEPLENKKLDGVSLLSSSVGQRQMRNLFLESGFKTLSVTADDMTIEKVINEGIKAYTVNDDGKLVVRDIWYDQILKTKHRAVVQGDWQLSMIPGMGNYLVLTNIPERTWWSLDQYDGDVDTEMMLASLCRHYDGEPGFDEASVCQ